MMKKKFVALALMSIMSASMLAACGGKKSDSTTSTTATTTETTAATDNKSAASTGKKSEAAPEWTAYDELIQSVYQDADLVHREATLHKAEAMLMDTGAVAPLYYYNDLYMQKPDLQGGIVTIVGSHKHFMYMTNKGQPIDVLRINLASEPDKLDPALTSTNDGGSLAENSFVGLYVMGNDNKISPALADGDPTVSSDGKEYTIKLKKDLKWSDGSPLNANDFVYSWKRAADPKTGSDYSYLFDIMEKGSDGTIDVSAVDDNTLKFKLKAPVPYMMELLTFPTYMPVPKASVEGAKDHETNPGAWASEAGFVSNGAYTLKEWKHNESMVYVKNPNFYDADKVTVNELHFMLSADDTAILAAYQAGNLDFIDSVPNGEIDNLKSLPDFHVVNNLGTYYVGFNVNSKMFDGKTPEQASKMRRALGLLIDRQYIVDTIGKTGQQPANTFVPAGMSDGHGGIFKQDDDAYKYPVDGGYYKIAVDKDQAISLLKEAGYKFDDNGMLSSETPITINYLVNQNTGNEAIAQAIQQDWAAIGITMNISTEDWQTFVNDRKVGNFDVAREGWLADYNDPVNMLEQFMSTSGNNNEQLGK
jgi:putative dipeptide ABC transporter substrate-binding protein